MGYLPLILTVFAIGSFIASMILVMIQIVQIEHKFLITICIPSVLLGFNFLLFNLTWWNLS